ncbi:hypothetical protein QYR01_10620 [Brucella anthropi]|uniref:hypothetical protein n=1 Tax=Brucella anthropi TaxID=529 RepID=UPI002672A510|nr:hypothetical protein [Brucella anthropi]WKT94549.1 hypothetical protein QYR01_10620 [Brucella anthropi]
MNIVDVVALKWLDPEHTMLGGTVVTTEFGPIPVCFRENYDTEEGRKVWQDAHAGKYGPIFEYQAPPELTSEEKRELMPVITKRQLRLALVRHGISLAQVEAAIAAMPDGLPKQEAEIEWSDASEFRRLHPTLLLVAQALNLTNEQVDAMWDEAVLA